MLSGVATWVADGSAIPIWMYANNWTWTYVTNPAFRLDLIHHSFTIAKQYSTLFCCSWTCGLMLGVLSRRVIPVIAAMFCLMLVVRGIISAPQLRGQGHEAVFSLVFYSVIFPLIVLTMLVLSPAAMGHARRTRFGSLSFPHADNSLGIRACDVDCDGRAAVVSVANARPRLAAGSCLCNSGNLSGGENKAPATFVNTGSPLRIGLVASIALCQNLPTDYPQWRGKARDGSASAFSKPKSWPEKLTRRWKIEVGEGYATPIVVGAVRLCIHTT